MDWKNFEKDLTSFGAVLKMCQKNTCGRAERYRLHFKKMSTFLRKVLQIYSEIWIFCLIQDIDFQKTSVRGALKGGKLKTVLDEAHFIADLYSFP